MTNDMERIAGIFEDAVDGAWMDGYDRGSDEAWDEARDKGFDEGFNAANEINDSGETSIWVNFEGRYSQNYKFSTTDRNHPQIQALKDTLEGHNAHVENMNIFRDPRDQAPKLAVELRPRGPGHTFTNWIGLDNAEYYDVYIRNVFPK